MWLLNSGPWEEQSLLLTAEPPLQSTNYIFKVTKETYGQPKFYTQQNYPYIKEKIIYSLMHKIMEIIPGMIMCQKKTYS
jgi:thiamine kinase-like enzyme